MSPLLNINLVRQIMQVFLLEELQHVLLSLGGDG